MAQIFYFVNIIYLPPTLCELSIDYHSFLGPAFEDPNLAQGLKENLVDMIIQKTNRIDKQREKSKKKPLFNDLLREDLEEWIEIDQRYLGQMRPL